MSPGGTLAHLLKTPRDGGSQNSLDSIFLPVLENPSQEEIFPNIQFNVVVLLALPDTMESLETEFKVT